MYLHTDLRNVSLTRLFHSKFHAGAKEMGQGRIDHCKEKLGLTLFWETHFLAF